MNPISIFCPVTKRPVDTGIETDWSTFFSLRPFRLNVCCPECGGHHNVRVREGYLARSPANDALDGGRPRENLHLNRLNAQVSAALSRTSGKNA